ncbi:polysulfide reductase NrfD, partial [Candidatus Bathyarchaeota archaeon]|nr:polysulfide reductase NrfD [Candidatus Bathyarchaeota archaeon]
VYWGVYISNFVFLIGISHAGIAISAAVRLLRLELYRPLTRMAELLTIISLMLAAMNIVFDLGRPDRVLNMVFFADLSSPLVWDFISVSTYFILSIAYLFLGMREDLSRLADRLPGRRWLYKALSAGWSGSEQQRFGQERVLRWMAIIILPVMVSVHTTVAWIFGLQIAKPIWHESGLGPYFVTGAIVSGISMVTVIAWILRRLLGWGKFFTLEIFRGLGNFLRAVLLIYAYFMIAEQVTIRYGGESASLEVLEFYSTGAYAPYFWSFVILGTVIPFLILCIPRTRSIGGIVLASILVTVFMWVKRVIIIIPALMHPVLPPGIGMSTGIYAPTWVEWSILGGSYALGALLYTIFMKFFPIIDLEIGK